MIRPSRQFTGLLFALLAWTVPAPGVDAQQVSLEARIDFERGRTPVLGWGDRERIYFSVDADAHVAIMHIDTDGDTRLVYPRSPLDVSYVEGGRDHRLLFPRTSTFEVREDPGMGYFFIIASTEPLGIESLEYSNEVQDWDLRPVGQRVFTDPYEAVDRWVEFLIPDWEYVPFAVDVAEYHVDQRHDYPRFVCYGCHVSAASVRPGEAPGHLSYADWNPYVRACTSVQVVRYDDPVYYPVTRYGGSSVVFVNPVFRGPRYGFERHDEDDEPSPYVATRVARPREDRRPSPVRRPVQLAVDASRASPRPEVRRRAEANARPRTVDLGVVAGPAPRPGASSRSQDPTRRGEVARSGSASEQAGIRVIRPSSRATGSATNVRSSVTRSGVARGSTTPVRAGEVRRAVPSTRATPSRRGPTVAPGSSVRVPRSTRGSSMGSPSRPTRSGAVRSSNGSRRPMTVRRPSGSSGTSRVSSPVRSSSGESRVRTSRPTKSGASGAVRRKKRGGGNG